MWRLLSGVVAGGLLAAALLGGGFRTGYRAGYDHRDAVASKAAAAAGEAQAEADRQIQRVVAAADVRHTAEAARIRDVYRTVAQEIPAHVTSDTDARFPLPNGFVRLHDAAALGLPPAAVDPGGLDDAASDIGPAQAAGVIAGNYQACVEAGSRLREFQRLARELGWAPAAPDAR